MIEGSIATGRPAGSANGTNLSPTLTDHVTNGVPIELAAVSEACANKHSALRMSKTSCKFGVNVGRRPAAK